MATPTYNIPDPSLEAEEEDQVETFTVDSCPATSYLQPPSKTTPRGLGRAAVKKGKELFSGRKKRDAKVVELELDDFKPADFQKEFQSACEVVDAALRKLVSVYKLPITDELNETWRQLMEKLILLTVLGFENSGKSTLLNSLLGGKILPMGQQPETSATVLIQHNKDNLLNEGPKMQPQLKLAYAKDAGGLVHRCENIYKKLHSLNEDVRGGQQEIVTCTLTTFVPFLADAPSGWQVSLVDTPGFGEFNSRVEARAKEALKSSSASVYITTYENLCTEVNAKYLKLIHTHYQGVFRDNRVIIVITKFDLVNQSFDEDEVTEGKVKEQTCQFVAKACPGATILPDDVLPVSGRWAYNARMLANTGPEEPNHNRCQTAVKNCLRHVPNATCGQGEDPNMSLDKLGDDVLSAKLEEASGIIALEERITMMTKSCVKIWVSKMRDDYDKYLQQALDQVKEARENLGRLISSNKQQLGLKSQFYNAIECSKKELIDNMSLHEKSKVYQDIAAKYPMDLQVSQPQESGKRVVAALVDEFQRQCFEKVNDKQVEFGPHQLEADLKVFLGDAAKELEKTFNNTCAFAAVNQVLMKHVGEMKETVERMRANAQHLCGEATSPLRASLVVNILPDITTECEGSYEALETPNLGYIKEQVEIPSVKLSLFMKILQHFSALFRSFWQRFFTSSNATESTEPASYREWSSELKDTMQTLRKHLEEECDAYFLKIEKHAVKYFYDQYCWETMTKLQLFDTEFKRDIETQVTKLQEDIKDDTTKLGELDNKRHHISQLKTQLRNTADKYLRHLSLNQA